MPIGIGIGLSPLVHKGSLVNYTPPTIPDGVILSMSGKMILSVDGRYVLTVDGFVPLNALMTSQGNYIKTSDNKYLTI